MFLPTIESLLSFGHTLVRSSGYLAKKNAPDTIRENCKAQVAASLTLALVPYTKIVAQLYSLMVNSMAFLG